MMLLTVELRTFMAIEQVEARLPVRSALFKQRTGGLVVRWVTTSEYPLLYVFWLSSGYCYRLFALSLLYETPLWLFNGSLQQTEVAIRCMQNSRRRSWVIKISVL